MSCATRFQADQISGYSMGSLKPKVETLIWVYISKSSGLSLHPKIKKNHAHLQVVIIIFQIFRFDNCVLKL